MQGGNLSFGRALWCRGQGSLVIPLMVLASRQSPYATPFGLLCRRNLPTDFSCFPDATDAKQRPGKQFLINFFGLLPEDQAADDQRGGDASGVGEEACREGVTSPADRHRSEVDGQHVEGGLGAAEDRSRELGGKAVWAAGLHDFGKEARGRTTAQGADENEREDLRGKADQVEQWGEDPGQDVDASRGPEDSHRYEDRDEVGEDPQGDLDPLLGTLDELLIDGHAAQSAVEWEEADQEGNRHKGEGLDDGDRQ